MQKDRTQIVADLQRPWSLLSVRNYIAGALAAFGQQGLTTALFSSFLTVVYNMYLGLDVKYTGIVVSVSIIVDGVTDFLMGIVADRFRTKWGKAKHWFIWMSGPAGLLTAITWLAPVDSSQMVKAVYMFIVYNLFCTVLTTIRIPAASIGSLISSDAKVRGNLGFFVGGATTIATSLAGWLLIPCTAVFHDANGAETLATYRLLGVVCGVLAFITLFVTGLLLTEERTKEDWAAQDKYYEDLHGKKSSWLADLANLAKNKYWIFNTVISFCSSFAMGFAFGTMAYFMQFVMGDMSKMALLLTVMSVPNYIGCIVGLPLANILDARVTMVVSYILQTICCAVMWAAGAQHFSLVLIGMGFKAFCTGATMPASTVISANIVDYGEWVTGARQDTLTRSWSSVFQKIASAIVTVAMSFGLAACGYNSGAEMTEAGKNLIEFLFLGFSTFMCAISAVLYLFMNLSEKKMKVYRQEIAERKAAQEHKVD